MNSMIEKLQASVVDTNGQTFLPSLTQQQDAKPTASVSTLPPLLIKDEKILKFDDTSSISSHNEIENHHNKLIKRTNRKFQILNSKIFPSDINNNK